MKELIYKAKKDKLFLSLCIDFLIMILLDFALAIFDIVQLVIIKNNSAELATGFLGFNLAVVIFNVLSLIFLCIYLILKRK